jgi:tetratricopeptide (TPR) repeat protein
VSTGEPAAAEAPAAGRALHLIGADAFERGAVDELLDAADRGAFASAAVTAVASAGSQAEALADTFCRIGLLLLQHGRTEAAVGAYRMALAYWPQHAGALLLLGRVHRTAGDFAAAEECVRRLAALEPQDGDVRRELALALLGGGKLIDADRAAQMAVQLAPFAAAAWHLLGVVRARRERPAQAAALIGEGSGHGARLARPGRRLAAARSSRRC